MCLIEQHILRRFNRAADVFTADTSARFIYDLVTSAPPMSMASVKAASDTVERAMDRRRREAVAIRRSGSAPRFRIVKSDTPIAPVGLGAGA